MKTTKYPWDSLKSALIMGNYESQLISDEHNPHNRRIFWAKNWAGHPALLVEYRDNPEKHLVLPSFKYIRISDYRNERYLTLELLDKSMCDVFYNVCIDIASALQGIPESATKKACILRLERWSSLLKPLRARLSEEAQKGLIAELHFLKHDAFSAYGTDSAIRGWTGPEAGPRDFAYGQIFIEVKSKRGASNTHITISSEAQLNTNDTEKLFLYVAEINDALPEAKDGFTVTDIVEEIRELLESPLQIVDFDSKLAKIGYFDEDDYADQRWCMGSSYYYAIIDAFPKIDSRLCKPGVSKVTYQIDLDYCDEFQIERNAILSLME